MAKFIYKMQNVLEIKYKLEEQVKAEFAKANEIYDMEVKKLEMYVSKKHAYEEHLRELYKESLNIAEIRNTIDGIDKMKELIKQQIVEVNKASEVVEQVRQKLNVAMLERKTQEKLKEKAFEEFLQDVKAEEDKEVDELVSFKYGNK